MLHAMANRPLRVGKDAQHYGIQAESFKTLAAATRLSKVQASSLRIAAIYEHLAELAEGAPAFSPVSKQANEASARTSRAVPEHLPIGDAGEAEPRPARQEALAKKLSSEDRRIAHAASLELSRALCDVSFLISRATRGKLRRNMAEDRHFRLDICLRAQQHSPPTARSPQRFQTRSVDFQDRSLSRPLSALLLRDCTNSPDHSSAIARSIPPAD